MSTQRFMAIFVAAAVSALVCSASAQAQNFLSAVATTGNDTNDCTRPTPCRTFTRALAVTVAGGEIIVLDSGNYSAATIAQPVTIAATGVRASVFRGTAHPGFVINTTGSVAIKGISFNGLGIGTDGIHVTAVGALYLDNVEVQGFTGNGVNFGATGGQLVITNSVFRDCGSDGLLVTAGSIDVRGSAFINNSSAGLLVGSASAVAVDSVASHNGADGFATRLGGTLRLVRDEAVFNDIGFFASPSSTLTFEYSLASDNSTDAFINNGTMSGSSPGTSLLGGGTGGTTLSTADTLQ